ncbi:DNA-binding SAP [Penicillium coprophilum]|uniref:DNA-binding SAP n=1 Tax=Penicillium coprophilum TaxID=36646 RepID=UPI0023990450|nr:DNA-binding SAP [Penicillium coprophilum]KAJ5171588.1 DNA-binding SAP [Penicillium coprophilum]
MLWREINNGTGSPHQHQGLNDVTESSQPILPKETENDMTVKIAKSTKMKKFIQPSTSTPQMPAYRPTPRAHRSASASFRRRGPFLWTMRVGIMEGMLYAVLQTLRQERRQCRRLGCLRYWFEPGRVVKYWLEGGLRKEGEETQCARVKKAKIDIIGRWLSAAVNEHQCLSDTDDGLRKLELGIAAVNKICWLINLCLLLWSDADEGERGRSRSSSPLSAQSGMDEVAAVDLRKLDDLADCLLQGVTWAEWRLCGSGSREEGLRALDWIP